MTLLEYIQRYEHIKPLFTTYQKEGKAKIKVDNQKFRDSWENYIFSLDEHNIIEYILDQILPYTYYDISAKIMELELDVDIGMTAEELLHHELPDSVVKTLTETHILIDEPVKGFDYNIKYPYYRLRGKRLTSKKSIKLYDEVRDGMHIKKNWLNKHRGIIGANDHTYKYPNEIELLGDILGYMPLNIDMVVALTDWDSLPDYAWKANIREGEDNCGEYIGFLDHVIYGIWLHGNTIEIMDASKAKSKYAEYDKLYSIPNKKTYFKYLKY